MFLSVYELMSYPYRQSATFGICCIAHCFGNFVCRYDARFFLFHTCKNVNASVLSKYKILILMRSCYMYVVFTVLTCYTWSWTVYAVLFTHVEEIHTCLWSAKNRLSVAETNILFMYVWISNHLPRTKGKINPDMKTTSLEHKCSFKIKIRYGYQLIKLLC